MTNPFDDEHGEFHVLVNDEGQHSLWPSFADIPPGWRSVYGPAGRKECLERISEVWTDMRPLSLVKQMSRDGQD